MVEDEPLLLSTMASLLTRKGFSVTTASTSNDALRAIADESDFDVHVVDVSLPDMDGPSLLFELVRLGRSRPTVVVSGHAENEIVRRIHGLSSVVFLPKPYTFQQLVATMTSLLDGQNLEDFCFVPFVRSTLDRAVPKARGSPPAMVGRAHKLGVFIAATKSVRSTFETGCEWMASGKLTVRVGGHATDGN
jgi:DNA-binding response OmpR family regulator